MENSNNNITNVENPVKGNITRKIMFKNHVLRKLSTMASHYHFDKPVKQDELLSMMIEDIVEYFYKDKFIEEIKK